MSSDTLSIVTAVEKAQVASGNAFVVLAEIELMNAATKEIVETIFVANNNEDFVYQNETYVAFPFDLSMKQEAGAAPEITLTAIDLKKILMGKLQQYSGAAGSIVTIRIINSGSVTQAPELEEVFEVVETSAANFSITARLGIDTALRRQFPRRRQLRDRCAWRYRGPECGYTGEMPTCDLSLGGPNGCRAHANELSFGGFPSLRSRGIRFGN